MSDEIKPLANDEEEECTHEIVEFGSCAGCGESVDRGGSFWESPMKPWLPECQGRGWYHDGSEQQDAL